jgi:hypothetical protein
LLLDFLALRRFCEALGYEGWEVDVGKVWKLNVLWLVEGEITNEFYQQ